MKLHLLSAHILKSKGLPYWADSTIIAAASSMCFFRSVNSLSVILGIATPIIKVLNPDSNFCQMIELDISPSYHVGRGVGYHRRICVVYKRPTLTSLFYAYQPSLLNHVGHFLYDFQPVFGQFLDGTFPTYAFSRPWDQLPFDPAYPKNPNTLADNIRKCRKDKGTSQVDLAKRIGVSEMTIVNREKGSTRPIGQYFERLEKILGDLPSSD